MSKKCTAIITTFLLIALQTAAVAEDGLAHQIKKGFDEGSLSGLHSVISIVDGEPICLLYTSPSPRDATLSRMPASA